MAEFTPGPWAYRHASGCVEAVGEIGMMICQEYAIGTGPNGELSPSQEAFHNGNAQLIALAPELAEWAQAVIQASRMLPALCRELGTLVEDGQALLARIPG